MLLGLSIECGCSRDGLALCVDVEPCCVVAVVMGLVACGINVQHALVRMSACAHVIALARACVRMSVAMFIHSKNSPFVVIPGQLHILVA